MAKPAAVSDGYHRATRRRLQRICRTHFDEMSLELSAPIAGEQYRAVESLRRKLKPFLNFALKNFDGGGDEDTAKRFYYKRSIEKFKARVMIDKNGFEEEVDLKLSEHNLIMIGVALGQILHQVYHELKKEEGQGYELGSAFRSWLLQMYFCCIERNLSVRRWLDDGTPSPFCVFLYETHLHFPNWVRPHKKGEADIVGSELPDPQRVNVQSPSAMAKQMDRALARSTALD